jgi:glycerophosphoryl diester phosphodiesterase
LVDQATRRQWLTARPIAHRGLHDASRGIIENSASAASAAITANYGIEADLQIAADGEAMVFHDDALDRLTETTGTIESMPSTTLRQVRYTGTTDHILTLGELCDLIAGRSTLVLELKSDFDGDTRLVRRTADVLARYAGPVAVMSFDPDLIAAMRHLAPKLVRGMVADRYYEHPHWKFLTPAQKRNMAFLLHAPRSRPQFIAYRVDDLPSLAPSIARTVFGLPLLTWTVRTEADLTRARRHADQIIFEGFRA